MRKEICICPHIAACKAAIGSTLQTRVVILMHHREQCRTTNTARLAELTLPQCEIRLRGLLDAPLLSEGILDPTRHTLFLYPSPLARELTPGMARTLSKPVTLVVPDGSWGQAAKVSKREAFLKTVPHVKLLPQHTSQYGLRRGSRQHGLATIEAIAAALGVLEGPEIQHSLEKLFAVMVTRTLHSRGIRPTPGATPPVP